MSSFLLSLGYACDNTVDARALLMQLVNTGGAALLKANGMPEDLEKYVSTATSLIKPLVPKTPQGLFLCTNKKGIDEDCYSDYVCLSGILGYWVSCISYTFIYYCNNFRVKYISPYSFCVYKIRILLH
jgi:hypothetical protein